MYSVVLATMMAVTPAAPDHFCFGCHSYCGCWGYTSCYGCSGCSGCYGCYGCYGCSGCYGCYGCSGCYGCYGYTCHGCYGCGGCYGYTWYSYYPASCGCCGSVVVLPSAVVPEKPTLPRPKEEKKKKDDDVSRVTITAPAGVQLTVDGQPLAMQGTRQVFETPTLEAGRAYAYVFRAEGKRDGQVVVRERKVMVRAGESAKVDFSDLYQAAPARVTFVLPRDAKLFVENVPVAQAGARTFETPALEAGRHYTYTMRAEVVRDGRTLTQEQRVEVEASQQVTVEFKELPTLQAAQR